MFNFLNVVASIIIILYFSAFVYENRDEIIDVAYRYISKRKASVKARKRVNNNYNINNKGGVTIRMINDKR